MGFFIYVTKAILSFIPITFSSMFPHNFLHIALTTHKSNIVPIHGKKSEYEEMCEGIS